MPSQEHNAPWRDKELLHQKYVVEGYSSRELAELWDCGKKTILNWLKRFDIGVRNSHMDAKPWHDKETLRELYAEQGLTCAEIAGELGCSETTAQRWLQKHGLYRPYRDREWLHEMYHEEDLYIGEIAERANSNRKTVAEWLDKLGVRSEEDRPVSDDGPHRDEETLRELYKEEKLSVEKIADRLGCSSSAVRRAMMDYGISRRPWWLRGDSTVAETNGYRNVSFHGQDGASVIGVHRLVALAHGKMSMEEFRDSNVVVHHKNEIRWDNRPENLEVMSRSEHARMHQLES